VLIVGEHGTGREHLAQVIHAHGGHAQAHTTVDCSHLAAADLSPDEIARFERDVSAAIADPRPLFLRNVSDLPLAAQGSLERSFVQRELVSGGDAPARVVASAEPSIGESVERKLFRRDLFERLAVVRIDLPPLRQRPQDVVLLASVFLKDACRQHGLGPKTFSPSARALLTALPWLGNARELRLLTERLALLVSRGVVHLEDLLAEIRLDGAETSARAGGTLRQARERFERDYILSVLQRHRLRVGEAARELGIERTNLYRKIKQLRINV
jgi:DNA-binding NtrC family response regulator